MSNFALVGNPNSGKTTLFNALTGLRQKVGNYPGVTVERKEGDLVLPGGARVNMVDLPGTYSLTPHSPDEQITRDVLLGFLPDSADISALVNVVDVSNLERNLFLTTQLVELDLPMVVVLTMGDLAAQRGVVVDTECLAEELGVPVVRVDLRKGAGLRDLTAFLEGIESLPRPRPRLAHEPAMIGDSIEAIAEALVAYHGLPAPIAKIEASVLLSLVQPARLERELARWSIPVRECVGVARQHVDNSGLDAATALAEARYGWIGRIATRAVQRTPEKPIGWEDRLDRVLLHRFWGYAIFIALLVLVFEAMFRWASIPADAIQAGIDALGVAVAPLLPEGDLRDLVVAGVFGGVGNTLVFLPQILILFLCIAVLEDTGYLARAAFLMDRLMSPVGLHGKAFVPLLSSYACAIPGILSTRTIESPKARLLTILVAPLMSCSARIPVYALMTGAFLPNTTAIGIQSGGRSFGIGLSTLVLLGMYALGTVAAFVMAWLFNRTILKGEPPTFLMEMPAYRAPNNKAIATQVLERAWMFVKRAGTLILSISIVLWFLSTYPKHPDAPPSEQLEKSFAGRIGGTIEPLIKPLGFDARMGIGLVASFAAREVFVTAMGTIYNIDGDLEETGNKATLALAERMRAQRDPVSGQPVYTPLTAICLMVYYVLAMQCISTVAVVRRETNSWRWTFFQIGYMNVLAWGVTYLIRQIGFLFGAS